ncbi:MAG: type II secretion system protein [bacterium]|nr:type II secretion system protein [bacterium]
MKDMLKGLKVKSQGFTLLEVMAALAIISISLVVLLSSQNANISRSHYSDSLARAAMLAQKIISEGDVDKLVDGSLEGSEEAGNIVFRWEKVVTPSMVEGLKKLTVLVSWGDGKEYRLETYRAS